MRYLFVTLLLIAILSSCESEERDEPTILPTVTTADLTNITFTAATSGGEVSSDGGGSVTVRGVCVSLSHDPTIDDMVYESGSGMGVFVSDITELIDDRTYYVRAFATNSVGTSYGEEKSFSTPLLDTDSDGLPDRDEAPECIEDPTC